MSDVGLHVPLPRPMFTDDAIIRNMWTHWWSWAKRYGLRALLDAPEKPR